VLWRPISRLGRGFNQALDEGRLDLEMKKLRVVVLAFAAEVWARGELLVGDEESAADRGERALRHG
jgi:hypothetical protein